MTPARLTALKSRLTRAERSGDPEAVLKATEAAFAAFEAEGYPDCWHRWARARDDAQHARRWAA